MNLAEENKCFEEFNKSVAKCKECQENIAKFKGKELPLITSWVYYCPEHTEWYREITESVI